MARRPLFFYGWYVVITGAITMALAYGIRHTFSVFFPPILDEFGWSRGSTAFIYSLNLVVYGILGPLTGSLADRWKPRTLSLIGFVVLSFATAGCALAQELWHFYVLYGLLVPLGTSFVGWPIIAPALTNWFVKRRGMALGLGQMGGGMGFVYGIFVTFVISQIGWRYTYVVLAGILLVVLLPLQRLFFHYRPEDKGMKAYGAEELLLMSRTMETAGAHDWTFRQAVKTPRLWLLVISQSFYWGLGCYLVLAHQVRFAEDVGYTSTFAASILALFGVCMTAGQFLGFLSDRIGREMTVSLASMSAIIAIIALLLVKDTSQPWLLYLYAVGLGLGAGVYSPTIVAGAADIFHGKHFGAIAGLLLTGMGMGGIIGPWLGGYIYDVTGSYSLAFFLCIGFFFLSCIVFWLAAPRHALKIKVQT